MIFLPILLSIYFPLVFGVDSDSPPVEIPYVNSYTHKVFVDVGAVEENPSWANAWNYLDPEPITTELNPLWYFEPIDGWLIDYVNYITFEGDATYHWWQIPNDGQEVCFPNDGRCYTEWGENAVQIRSGIDYPDIDVVIVKVKSDPNYCPTCIPSWKP